MHFYEERALMFTAIGIVAIVLALAAQGWIGGRAFKRRNQAGVEVFNSYPQMLATRFGEKLGTLFAVALFITGVGLIALDHYAPDGTAHRAPTSASKANKTSGQPSPGAPSPSTASKTGPQ